MNHYVVLCAAVFTFMFVIWDRKTWLNVSIKMALFAAAIWGWYIIFRGGLL